MFKIGKPVSSDIPGVTPIGKGRFADIWTAVAALAPGEWLPVTFKAKEDVTHIANYAQRKQPRHQAKVRGLTVYLRVKPATIA
jgi:hypothetical protein